MRRLAVLLTATALGAAGCGGNDESASPGGGQGTAATSQVPFDRSFIDAMVPHHESAIEMAREALEAGLTEPELVTIANDIIASQQSEIDQMLEWREEWFGSKEPGPEEAALEELGMSAAGMEGMEPGEMGFDMAEDVDQAFAEMMISHHEAAIEMARLAEEKADHEEVKKLAGEIKAAQQREIETMKKYAGS